MNFKVFGPYTIARDGPLVAYTAEHRRSLWHAMEQDAPGLSNACGCYVFSIHRRAWYVGMASRQPFCDECFTPHKVNHYNYALRKRSGVPTLHFIAKLTPTERFAAP